MKKTMLSLLLATLLLLPALAFADIGDLPTERQQPLLVDEGDILTDSEEASLLAMLERISAEQKCDIVIVVPRSLGYKSATEYADDWYDLNGFGYGSTKDGILLMVCMEERDWATSTAGAAQDWFDDYTLERIESRVVSNLSNGAYYDAFTAFAEGCEQTLQGVDRRPVLYLDDAAGWLAYSGSYDDWLFDRDRKDHRGADARKHKPRRVALRLCCADRERPRGADPVRLRERRVCGGRLPPRHV